MNARNYVAAQKAKRGQKIHPIKYFTIHYKYPPQNINADEKAYDAPKGDSSGKHGTGETQAPSLF